MAIILKPDERSFMKEIEGIINKKHIWNPDENMRLRDLMRKHIERVNKLEKFRLKNS